MYLAVPNAIICAIIPHQSMLKYYITILAETVVSYMLVCKPQCCICAFLGAPYFLGVSVMIAKR